MNIQTICIYIRFCAYTHRLLQGLIGLATSSLILHGGGNYLNLEDVMHLVKQYIMKVGDSPLLDIGGSSTQKWASHLAIERTHFGRLGLILSLIFEYPFDLKFISVCTCPHTHIGSWD